MTAESVIRAVAADYNVEPRSLFEPKIYGRAVKARNLAMFFMRFYIGMSNVDIAVFFHRATSCATTATNRIMSQIGTESDVAVRFRRIMKSLEN
jgi:chromosomal replication initiation ATPase DnaA